MKNYVKQIFPNGLADSLLPLGKIEPPWLYLQHESWDDEGGFSVRFREGSIPPLLRRVNQKGQDWAATLLISRWVAHGPKVARPSKEMFEAMQEVEVRLQMADLGLPFPETVIQFPENIGVFESALVGLVEYHIDGRVDKILVTLLNSVGNKNDVTSLICQRSEPGWTIEDTLVKFHPDCAEDAPSSHLALRIALNCCLMLSGQFKPLLPLEEERDRRLGEEKTERGERARERLAVAVQIASFDQEIEFRRSERVASDNGEPTGREVKSHWRTGHWRLQVHGPHNSLRKRILIAPVLVRKDLFSGEQSDTCVVYK